MYEDASDAMKTSAACRSVTSAKRPIGICVSHSLARGASASDCAGGQGAHSQHEASWSPQQQLTRTIASEVVPPYSTSGQGTSRSMLLQPCPVKP